MVKFKGIIMKDLRVGIDMTPLIDIIFNLLIFFLITAAITVKGIHLDLPEASTSEKMPAKSWEIIIDKEDRIHFNDVVIDLNRFKKILESEKSIPEKERPATIIIKASRNARFGVFITVMDTARQYGFYDIVIATDPRSEDH